MIIFTILALLVIALGIYLYNLKFNPAIDACYVDDDCILSSSSNDPQIIPFSFRGVKGYGASAENIEVACISRDYYESNKVRYNLKAYSADFQIWTGSESKCGCQQNICKNIVYGAPQARLNS